MPKPPRKSKKPQPKKEDEPVVRKAMREEVLPLKPAPPHTEEERMGEHREFDLPESALPPLAANYGRWNNLCAALAEDALQDENPSASPEDVARIRKRIAQLIEAHRRGG